MYLRIRVHISTNAKFELDNSNQLINENEK